ncbi:hypothetical protein TYRP_001692, partial [Tyrophagus putrescentiae]
RRVAERQRKELLARGSGLLEQLVAFLIENLQVVAARRGLGQFIDPGNLSEIIVKRAVGGEGDGVRHRCEHQAVLSGVRFAGDLAGVTGATGQSGDDDQVLPNTECGLTANSHRICLVDYAN